MTRNWVFTAMVLVGLATTGASAQLSPSDRATIEAYRSAIRSAESGRSPRAVESAFDVMATLDQALTRDRNGLSVVESLSEEDFKRLQQQLPGVLISREEAVFVAPDADYFVKLAAARGDAADRTFASVFRATYPPGSFSFPVYIEQQTDISGCTRFGSMTLVEMYHAWSNFQRKFPGRYTFRVKKETDRVTEELTTSTCACGDAASVEREWQRFLREFPNSPARTIISRHLQELRAGHFQDGRPGGLNIRFHCMSG